MEWGNSPMKSTWEILVVGVLTVSVAGVAMAARTTSSVLATPYMTALGTDSLGCNAVNVGTQPLSLLKVELVNAANGVESTATCQSPTNQSDGCSAPAVVGPVTGYCRITTSGTPQSVRGSAWLMDAGYNVKVAVPAQ